MKYLIDIQQARETGRKMPNRDAIIQRRPSSWGQFLKGFLRINKNLAFVEMEPRPLSAFFEKDLAVRLLDGCLMVNGYRCEIKKWSFLGMCEFCVESLNAGFFWRFWLWRW